MKVFLPLFILFLTFSIKAQPPGCSGTNDVSGVPGQAGLYGEYFAGYHGESPSFYPSTVGSTTRIEPTLNYTSNNWGAIIPPAGGSVADADYYSSRYRGSIYIATAGVYTFYLTSDDGSYMWIDNAAIAYPTVIANALINNGGGHGDITITNTVSLTAGFHNIQIQFGEMAGGNHLIFEYSATSPSITRQVVPNSILCTGIQPAIAAPVITAPPGCSCSAGVTTEFYTGYFNDVQTYFTGNTPVITRVDPQIAFTTDGGWGNVCPPLAGSNASPETFSARFSGRIYIPVADTYTFYFTSDDAGYMWLDGNALATNPTAGTSFINNGALHSAATISTTVSLTAGLHDFKIHYGENTGNNVCYLEYASTGAGISRQMVPQSSYCSCLSTISTLPVELLQFSAEMNSEKSVLVKWKTATEKNNKQFDVERSADGLNFTKIITIASKSINGNSLEPLSYDVTDNDPLSGVSYYRLKQTDIDGVFKYHSIVSVNMKKNKAIIFYAYPNPNNGDFILSIDGIQKNKQIETKIFTMDGRLIFSKLITSDMISDNQIILKVDINLVPGVYLANCTIDGINYPIKIIVN